VPHAEVAASYRRHHGVRHHDVVPNAVYEASIAAALATPAAALRAAAGVPADTALLFIGGRLTPEKGHRVALEALARLRAAGRRVALWMVGDGPLEADIRAHVAALGLRDHARMFPAVPNPEMLRRMATCDVVVAPSFHEGMPMVVLEAMALGRPLVASHIGPMTELLDDGASALLVPTDDAAALAAAVARLLDEPALGARLARVARERVLRDHGAGAIAARWERYYGELLGRG
jgi:glycosyltransferase involved in cell wall biosynthesis